MLTMTVKCSARILHDTAASPVAIHNASSAKIATEITNNGRHYILLTHLLNVAGAAEVAQHRSLSLKQLLLLLLLLPLPNDDVRYTGTGVSLNSWQSDIRQRKNLADHRSITSPTF